MQGIRIISTGISVPERIVTNADLAAIVDTSDEWIKQRTGMAERRYLKDGETLLQLISAATEEAVNSAGIAKEEIGVVLVATMSADYFTPSMACLLQKDLSLSEDILALDINAACSGFVFGLVNMQALLSATGKKYGILIGAEALSRKLDMEDRGTCILFGDGAAAAVIQADEDNLFEAVYGARGDDHLISCEVTEGLIRMDGKSTYLFA
nr:3-oxoacyl-ACP synthase [Lachnospiraceae bacterium]